MSTSFLRESVGITSPITHSGRVVYNAKRDYLETRRRKTMRGCVRVYERVRARACLLVCDLFNVFHQARKT